MLYVKMWFFFYNAMNAMFMRWSLHLQYLLWYCSHWYTGVLVIDMYQNIIML